jgi:hypothetical protein
MEKDARCRYRRLGAVQAQRDIMVNTNTQLAWQTQDTYIVIALPTSHRKWIPSVRKRNSSSAEKWSNRDGVRLRSSLVNNLSGWENMMFVCLLVATVGWTWECCAAVVVGSE